MTVQDIKNLAEGKLIEVLEGKGKVVIDFDNNVFLAVANDGMGGFGLNIHNTFEEAIQEIIAWYKEEN